MLSEDICTEDEFQVHHVLCDPSDLAESFTLHSFVFVCDGDLGCLDVVGDINIFVLGLLSFFFVGLYDHLLS